MLTSAEIESKMGEVTKLKNEIENALKEKNYSVANEKNKTRYEIMKELQTNGVKLEIPKK